MQCANCQFENMPGVKACGRCGASLQLSAMAISVHPPRAAWGLATAGVVVYLPLRNRIREREVHLLYNEMQTGRKFQMQTMDNALLDLYQRGEITYDAALSNAREPDYVRHKTGGKPN